MLQPPASSRQQELDVFRGFAILSVLSYHFTSNFETMFGSLFGKTLFSFPEGLHGVSLFFVISGYVILMTLENTKNVLDFIVARFARLYPVYWFSVILIFLTAGLAVMPRSHTTQEFFVNLSMLQSWFNIPHLDPVFWTLTVELSFYLLMGIALATRTLYLSELFGFLWLLLMIINKFFLPAIAPLEALVFIFHSLLLCGNFFVMGIFFYKIKTCGPKWWRHLGIALALAVNWIIWKDPKGVLASLICIVLFYLFVFDKLKFLRHPALIFFGTISYSLYLIHESIGYIIIQWLALHHFSPWFKFFVPLVTCVALASLITFFIEQPAMKWIKSMYRSTSKKPAGQAAAA